MLLFHGSKKDIEGKIKVHKAISDEKFFENPNVVYCSNNPVYAFAFSIIKNTDWLFDGIDSIAYSGNDIINDMADYVYVYFIITDNYVQISKRQFVLEDETEYILKKKIAILPFIKIDTKKNIIEIRSQELKQYIMDFYKLYFIFRRLCNELEIVSNKFVILEEMTDCDENGYYCDNIYGYLHLWNTTIYTIILCELNAISDNKINKSLIKSAYYHDIGRYIGKGDIRHGEKGAELFVRKYKLNSDENLCEDLIRKHDVNINGENEEYLYLLKDADAIDRLRLGPDKVNVERLHGFNSKMLYEHVIYNYREIYINEKIKVIAYPFYYNGPCVAGNGALAIVHEMNKNFLFHDFEVEVLNEKFDESPKHFLERVEKCFENCEQEKKVILTGNHLGVLPIYKATQNENITIVVLDAHRDYRNEEDISHASFMRHVANVPIVIYGFRDDVNEETPNNIKEFSLIQKKEFLSYIEDLKTDIYLDIDVDVIDPQLFPCTYCKVDGGISIEELYEIIESVSIKMKLLSISEYVPIFDNKGYYNIIEEILLRGFRRKV